MYQISGVYVSLHERIIVNNSNVNGTTIEVGDNGALLCYTDFHQCCSRAGENTAANWYFPNGTVIDSKSHSNRYVFVSRGPSVVRLHRNTNATMPTGEYVCKMPNARGRIQVIVIKVESSTTNLGSSRSQLATIVGGAAAGVLVLAIVIVAVALLMKR